MPFDAALDLARAFAAAEPGTVVLHIDTLERETEIRARELGSSYLVPLLERDRAGWALCRQWAGFDAALAERDAEVKRLREIIERTIWDLRHDGQDELSHRLERKLRGR